MSLLDAFHEMCSVSSSGAFADGRSVEASRQEIIQGNCLDVFRKLKSNSIDGMVTDPPAGIAFMSGKERLWDDFRRAKNANDAGRDNVFGRRSSSSSEYGRGERANFIAWITPIFTECLRVLKPGSQALVWSIPRTSHWTAIALEDAGFNVDTVIQHIFGSGMPASKNIGRAIDMKRCILPGKHYESTLPEQRQEGDHLCPKHPDGNPYRGVGTALKGAVEFWILVQKPVEGTYAENVLAYGTGGLNIDTVRVPRNGMELNGGAYSNGSRGGGAFSQDRPAGAAGMFADGAKRLAGQFKPTGGFPSHLILSHDFQCVFLGVRRVRANGAIAQSTAAATVNRAEATRKIYAPYDRERGEWQPYGNGDGTETVEEYECVEECPIAELNRQAGHDVARYFYVPKPTRRERDLGCENLLGRTGADTVGREEGSAGLANPRAGAGRTRKEVKNYHVTVKSMTLMRYLIKMISRPGQIILDPFMGSGTTLCAAALEGVNALGIEQDAGYVEIARARLAHWQKVAEKERGHS